MQTPKKPQIQFSIPKNWTVEQADAVWEFLNDIAIAVFDSYADPLCELMAKKHCEQMEMDEKNKHDEKHDGECDISF